MGVSIARTWNESLIRHILTQDHIWDSIAEDGQEAKDFEVDLDKSMFLSINAGETCIGLYILHAFNGATLQIHANVLRDFRDRAKESGEKVLEWIRDNAPDKYQKVIAQIPEIYPNVYHFTKNRGFKDEGLITNAYRKNGKLVDLHILGLDRVAIKRE